MLRFGGSWWNVTYNFKNNDFVRAPVAACFLFNSLLFALGPGGHGTEIYSGTVLRNRAARERNRTRGMKKVILQ